MFDPNTLPEAGFERLIAVMACLRSADGGCPWDLQQSLDSLKPYLIEECYETLDAIDGLGAAARTLQGEQVAAPKEAIEKLREELGDVLLQVIFQAQIAEELAWFDAASVATGIADKMVRRHPHVFDHGDSDNVTTPTDNPPLTATEVLNQWEQIKRKEGRGALSGVPRNLPALLRAQRIGEKAARIGFDWPDKAPILAKIDEELEELREAMEEGDQVAIRDELGDVLFALTSLARHLQVDAEQGLSGALDRFTRRFEHVEQVIESQAIERPSLEQLEVLWQQAKALERQD